VRASGRSISGDRGRIIGATQLVISALNGERGQLAPMTNDGVRGGDALGGRVRHGQLVL
jgi:hypothetical protein